MRYCSTVLIVYVVMLNFIKRIYALLYPSPASAKQLSFAMIVDKFAFAFPDIRQLNQTFTVMTASRIVQHPAMPN